MKNFYLFTILLMLVSGQLLAATAEIFQREFIYSYSSTHSEVQTGGLNTCVGVVLYHRDSTETVLAHVDAGVDPQRAMDTLLSSFSNKEGLVAWVYGGIVTSRLGTYQKILQSLEREKITVIDKAQNKGGNDYLNIRFNLEKGELIINRNSYIEIPYSIRQAKTDRLKFERRMFRHEQSVGGGDDPLQYYTEPSNNGGFGGFPF